MDYLSKIKEKPLSIVEMQKLSEKGYSFFEFNKVLESGKALDFFIEILLLRCPEADLNEVDGVGLVKTCSDLLNKKDSEPVKN